MTSIENLISNFNDFAKTKSVTDVASKYTNNNIFVSNKQSPSLSQGNNFKKYQKKIHNNLEKKIHEFKEGFSNNPDSLTSQSNTVIQNNSYQKELINNLQQEYQTTLSEYKKLIEQINKSTNDYMDRVNSTNPYLGKNIIFTTGEQAYVTKQGVVKLYPVDSNGVSIIFENTAGKNGCPTEKPISINLPWNANGKTLQTTPSLIMGSPMQSGQSCGNEGSNIFVNKMLNYFKTNYEGCYADNVTSPLMTFINGSPTLENPTNGTFDYEQCQQSASDGGYQYFALQSVNSETSKGYCAVSNSLSDSKSLGDGLIPTNMTPLWASNTSGQTGNTAILKNTGALSVLNSSSSSVFNTPYRNARPSNYLGCYGDNPNRAMPLYNNGSQQYNLQQCQQIAQQNGATYFGLQNSTSGGNAQCTLSSDWAQTSEYGVAGNCTKIGDGSWSGGGWSNAVYNTTIPNSNYFLILQDDGNMVIYRGTSPTDNQGAIWASKTNSKQKEANPAYAAINGKYGQNWIASDSTLASGDFVGSTNGNLALIMQTDGNLVLYTFEMEPNCKKMTDGNTGGGVGANALYNIGSVGILSNLLKVGYVDQDSKIYEYPQNNIQYNNKYTKMEGVDSPGNDIPGATFDNATEESCTTACSNNTQCAGFSVSNNVCYPKTSSMYPTGNKTYDSNSNLFIRGKSPINNPVGVPSDINNIDSVLYQNYLNGGDIGTEYGLANATSIQKQQLSQIQTKMDQLSSQISTLTGKLGRGSNQVETQAQNNVKGIKTYLNNIKNANLKIVGFDTNVENILKDSDIVVLQKNYDYLFWSILAAGTVLIAMNVVKK
jgi:hypothetical protein